MYRTPCSSITAPFYYFALATLFSGHIHPIHREGEWQNSATLPHDGWDGYGFPSIMRESVRMMNNMAQVTSAVPCISPFCHSPSYTLPLERVSNGSVYEGDWQNDEIHGTAEVTCAMMFIILPLSLMMDGMDTVPMARKQCCGIRIQNEYGT